MAVKPKRTKKGRFKSWPGGKREVGAWPRFMRSLSRRGKYQVTTRAGVVYKRAGPGKPWRRKS